MNDVKAYLLLVMTCGVFGSSSAVIAATKLADSSFQDWSGSLEQTNLPDGSILSEYTAKTSSAADGATLALSFVPRFSCTPMISLQLPEAMVKANAGPVLEMSIDDVPQSFNGYLDGDGDFMRYSLAATAKELIALRQIIDVSSRVSVRVLPAVSVGDDAGKVGELDADAGTALEVAQGKTDSVEFSLIGSQRAAVAVEKHCKMHQSAAYVPNKTLVQNQ